MPIDFCRHTPYNIHMNAENSTTDKPIFTIHISPAQRDILAHALIDFISGLSRDLHEGAINSDLYDRLLIEARHLERLLEHT